MGFLRKILGVSRISHIRNTDIKNQLNIQHDSVDRIRSRRLRYFGHVVRMQPSRWPHRALYARVRGNRLRGRPKKRWTVNSSDDCQMMGLSLTQATRGWGQKTMEGIHEAVQACLTVSPWHRTRRMSMTVYNNDFILGYNLSIDWYVQAWRCNDWRSSIYIVTVVGVSWLELPGCRWYQLTFHVDNNIMRL